MILSEIERRVAEIKAASEIGDYEVVDTGKVRLYSELLRHFSLRGFGLAQAALEAEKYG